MQHNDADIERAPFEDIHPPFDDRYTEEEWAAELTRRIDEMESGRAEMISWEQAIHDIREAGERVLRFSRKQN